MRFSRLLASCLAAFPCVISAQATSDPLRETFASPPAAYRPLTWWHWVNGNISIDGIDRDLTAMKEAGIGGFHLFDVSMAAPGPVRFGSPEWKEARAHALRRANELGLFAGLQTCPGWATAGGPWVPVERSMKRLVFSETWVEGGATIEYFLQPASVSGFYRDVATFAVPVGDTEWNDHLRRPSRLTVVGHPEVNLSNAADGDEATVSLLPEPTATAPVVVEIEYTQPFAPTTFELVIPPVGWPNLPAAKVEALANDGSWQLLREFKVLGSQGTAPVTALALRPSRASRFRLTFAGHFDIVNPSALAEIRLLESPRLEDWAGHSLRTHAGPTIEPDQLAVGAMTAIDPAQVVDLSHLVARGGVGHAGPGLRGGVNEGNANPEIQWTAPPGRWVVLRFGFTSTGKTNHPAQPEGTGFEVDKMDGDAVRDLLSHSLFPELSLPGVNVSMALIDSWEAGSQNWTDTLPQRFQHRFGYDLRAWLPAFTGRPVGSLEDSRRFFWDFRRLVSQEIADQCFGTFADELEKRGVKAYAEPYGAPFDNSEGGRHAHVPMAEFWIGDNDVWTVKDMSSVAHVEGRSIVAAESFTAGGDHAAYREAPSDFKLTGDRAFARGLNQVVLHSYVHQPHDAARPGFSLGQFGSHFQRHESWFPLMKPWTDYLARCHVLLREGRSVNDLAFARIDSSPTGPDISLYGAAQPPPGLDFDFVGADDLRHASWTDGALQLPSGARYRVLVLARSRTLSPDLAEHLADLVEAGLQVVGEKPDAAPGLSSKREADARVRAAMARLTASKRGAWQAHSELSQAVSRAALDQDFLPLAAEGSVLSYTHRQTADRDIYFVANSSPDRPFTGPVRFRDGREQVELWDPLTGEVRELPASGGNGCAREVALALPARHSCFVVFSGKRVNTGRTVPAAPSPNKPSSPETLLTLDTGWTVQVDGHAPVKLETLRSLTENPVPALRHATGRARYRTEFTLGPEMWRRLQRPNEKGVGIHKMDTDNRRVEIVLGSLRAVTRLTVNGIACGGTWLAPHALDLTRALRPGRNAIEIEISLPWANRLIADVPLDADEKWNTEVGYSAIPTWVAEPPLAPDGVRRSFSSYRYFKGGERAEPAGLLQPVLLVLP
jgi:hypothetical protein